MNLIQKIKSILTPCKHYEMITCGNVYHRITYSKKNLKKKDFITGFGYYSEILNQIHQARIKYNEENPDKKLPLRGEFHDQYDNRIGHYITGEKINTRIHPLHDKQLMDVNTKQKYIIDTVTYSNWYGKYITLMVRKEGSKSHGHILWENISCLEPGVIRDIKKNQKKFILIDKFDPFTL